MIAEALSIYLALGAPAADDLRLPRIMYRPTDRSVSNWRFESFRHLDLTPENTAKFLAGQEPARLPRCIRLNNYWCIKSARWNGEIATDGEGHVAFSSGIEGAAVAVALLRRYYLEFGRKSALSIVSRWAPAQCGTVAARAPSLSGAAAARPSALAKRGLGNTLRAKFLANKGRAGAKGRVRLARSVVPDRPMPMMRAPSIAAGMGERNVSLASTSLAGLGSLGAIAASDKGGAAIPRISCAGEAARVRNYANSVVQGVSNSIDEDLKLFEPHGAPTANLARVMANMAAVEIGPYKPGGRLIEIVVAAAIREAEERRAKAAAQN